MKNKSGIGWASTREYSQLFHIIEDKLKPGEIVYRFNAECYRNTRRAIQIWRDIWLPKSQIKIVWGEMQIDYVDVTLFVFQVAN